MAPELPAFLNVARVGPELPTFLKGGNLKGDRVVLDPPLPHRPRQNHRHPLQQALLVGLVGFLAFISVSALLGMDPTNPNPSVPSEVHKR
jgi:hypothetical protein